MRIQLVEASSGKSVDALIVRCSSSNLPLKKDGWQFTWKRLGKTEGAEFCKIVRVSEPGEIEGVLMLTLLNGEMLYMNNIEVAPHNFGEHGRYDRVAGCLIAFACYKSFEEGTGHYIGYLTFDSRTKLIDLYQNKYGATHAMGQQMFINPDAGRKLMDTYLN
ncbi:hypothetical protein CLV84_0108 [Neolewinella xylanilytica]|uniref:N-acetyltransferase domain-containing protein n=1 Tax=Neolewinella xylanilytica TaxID=1514080 RepID=A0A2S6I6N0_9BACT|nr:hypothetical protein CLV84_0108 [Neolewinella xylanilytica]